MGNKAVSHKPTSEEYSSDHEESGWTAYFQDFSNNHNNNIDIKDHENYHENILEESFCTISSSLVSDAASYAAWKIDHDQTPKKLSFKKTRAKEISQDDSLEDTASSPVNSPKVGDLKPVDQMKHKQTYDLIDDSQKTVTISGKV
ncbi:hypothetical protein TIFTF001_027229 [Ficus carica]|uniref:Uncharacterized protein n=1 Tax=Ficus carica TaxID=3494 RepID=A0AA88IZB0_FICCA|nr:hypothetical protein TIFTF001_027229 [Ficus carica]